MNQAKKILIVEDEQPMANAFKLKLEHAGYQIDIAVNGKEALKKLKTDHFDLMILDIILPQMDGFELLEKRNDKTPVILTTNMAQDVVMERVKKFDILDFFIKSDTTITEVVRLVQKHIGTVEQRNSKNA